MEFKHGVAIHGDSTHDVVLSKIAEYGPYSLVVTDPPYGNIVSDKWDKIETNTQLADVLSKLFGSVGSMCTQGAALYVWGGYGKPLNRVFYRMILCMEHETPWRMANHITWKKKRAYGVQHNYLSIREECAYFVLGDVKKPRTFNVPYLDKERGYAGYNPNYPARSKYLRRTSVWDDITEILRGKVHVAQKPTRLFEIPIEVHTSPNEPVLDLFAGSGTTAKAAINLGRRFVVVERNADIFQQLCSEIEDHYSIRTKAPTKEIQDQKDLFDLAMSLDDDFDES